MIDGLQLAAISLAGRADTTAFIDSFTGSHHFVLDYLVEEVLHQLPAEIHTFLLQTSILERLCGPLCEALLDLPAGSGQTSLERIERANLFIVSLDRERRWYRYHHLFAELLRQRLHEGSPGHGKARIAELHRRVSIWYEEQAQVIEAFRHATIAGDIDRAARRLEGNGMPLHFRGAVAPVLRWLASLPAKVLNERPVTRSVGPARLAAQGAQSGHSGHGAALPTVRHTGHPHRPGKMSGTVHTKVNQGENTMKRTDFLIEADELLDRIGEPTLRIFDATILFFRQDTDATAYQRYLDGHIPGAAFFDHDDFSDPNSKYMYMVLDEPDLAAQIGQIGIDHESEVIVYTYDMLPSATRAWWVLRYAGHDNVRVLNGGLDAWKQAGGALETGPRKYAPTRFQCRLRPEMFVSREEVETALADGNISTVHTLPPDSYAEAHIPGTACVPFTELMHEMASFLPEEVLVRRLSADLDRKRVITYCGGGIAATVNGMAHLMAGNQNVAVYDGSLSEWAGEGLPIAQGLERDSQAGSGE